ncbi:MAG: GNAT family N-acetyltransferase [Planctomycetes bacterium]|nr:GNAT family N-acetyltransferase [Planctomycetota bacterium]
MIRPITRADVHALVALAEAACALGPLDVAGLREALDDADHRTVVDEASHELHGFACYTHVPMTEGTWLLVWLAARKDRQRQGVGGRLLHFVEDDIRTKHHGRVLFIEVKSSDEMMRRFFSKNGFEHDAELKDFYADGVDKVVYRKVLK